MSPETPSTSWSPVDAGLLFLRVGLGSMMITHGWGKLMGGPELWEKLGGAMAHLGLDFAPTFWGFAAAATETFGALFLILGVLTRVQAGLLAFTMLVAAVMHLSAGDGLGGASHAIGERPRLPGDRAHGRGGLQRGWLVAPSPSHGRYQLIGSSSASLSRSFVYTVRLTWWAVCLKWKLPSVITGTRMA